ncbi:MAG: hypothetical protein M3N16_07985 [Actinomycetota bacterium]|nr:hypothetical protein [Actinomycetota bacterium]
MEPILFAAGLAAGLLVGRWWALLAPVAFGVWVGLVTEVEVGGLFLGTAYAVISGAGTAAGVAVRKSMRRYRDRRR